MSKLRFDRPPIHEVAISAQFRRLTKMTTAHVGSIWARAFQSGFPKVEEHDPIANVTETFDQDVARLPRIKFMTQVGTQVRTWFVGKTGHELVQVQADRFVRNWRRVGDKGEYPRFEAVCAAFEKDLRIFTEMVDEEKVGPIEFDQCELTYVDHAFAGEGFDGLSQLPQVVKTWSWPAVSPGIEPEKASSRCSYVLREEGGAPWGRIHAAVTPRQRLEDQRTMVALEFTARGAPQGEGCDGVVAFVRRAHDILLNLFVATTTEKMHETWGIQRDA